MNGILDWGVQVVVFIQTLGGWLLTPMKIFSEMGSAYFFLIVMPLIYWCVNAEVGLRLGLILMFNEGFNDFLKVAFHAPRPYWYSNEVKALSSESTFGLPSGHAQRAVVAWGILADWLKHRWAWAIALLMIFLISLSRIYLAVHFPTDVLVGWLIGAFILWGLLRITRWLSSWYSRCSLIVQILMALLPSILLLGLGITARLALSDWQMPALWLANAARAGGNPPAPVSPDNMIISAGVLFGMAAGAIGLRRYGGFAPARGTAGQMIARYVLGLLGMAILWYGLGNIIPQRANIFSYILHYLQYTLIGIWFTGLAPEIFVRLGLAVRESE